MCQWSMNIQDGMNAKPYYAFFWKVKNHMLHGDDDEDKDDDDEPSV